VMVWVRVRLAGVLSGRLG